MKIDQRNQQRPTTKQTDQINEQWSRTTTTTDGTPDPTAVLRTANPQTPARPTRRRPRPHLQSATLTRLAHTPHRPRPTQPAACNRGPAEIIDVSSSRSSLLLPWRVVPLLLAVAVDGRFVDATVKEGTAKEVIAEEGRACVAVKRQSELIFLCFC